MSENLETDARTPVYCAACDGEVRGSPVIFDGRIYHQGCTDRGYHLTPAADN